MHGRKYVVWRLLWEVGCACSRLGMGPGLGWISPHRSRSVVESGPGFSLMSPCMSMSMELFQM